MAVVQPVAGAIVSSITSLTESALSSTRNGFLTALIPHSQRSRYLHLLHGFRKAFIGFSIGDLLQLPLRQGAYSYLFFAWLIAISSAATQATAYYY